MAVKYKKEKRQLRHFLESTFNLWTRKMSLKKLKFFYKEFLYIQKYLNGINSYAQQVSDILNYTPKGGDVIQYMGAETPNFKPGYFYKYDGSNWVNIPINR